MSSAPRSAGTESLSAFRQEMSKLLPPRADSGRLRTEVFAVLLDGEPHTVAEIAARVDVDAVDVLRALGLPADTPRNRPLRLRVEDEAPPPEKRARSTRR